MRWHVQDFAELGEALIFLNSLKEKQACYTKIVCRASAILGTEYYVIYPVYEE